MEIRLSPETEARIREKVASGLYADENDVVLTGLRLLDEARARKDRAALDRSAEEQAMQGRQIREALESDYDASVSETLQMARLKQSIIDADAEIDRGLGVVLDETTFETIRQNARKKIAEGHIPDSDV